MNKYYHKALLAAGYSKDSEEYRKVERFFNRENKKFRRRKKTQANHEIVFNYTSSFIADEEDQFDCFPSDEDVEEKVFHEIEMEAFRECLSKLPESDRRFLLDIYRGDRSLRDIASEKGVTHQALMKRRDRLFKRIRKMMLGEIS